MNDEQSNVTTVQGTLSFEGEGHEVDARTAVASISALDGVVSDIKASIKNNRKTITKLKPFEPGSFIIPFELCLIPCRKEGLFQDEKEEYSLLELIIKTLDEYMMVKLFLHGKAPMQIEENTEEPKIIRQDGESIRVSKPTLFLLDQSKCHTEERFCDAFQCAKHDESIQGISIKLAGESNIIKIKREDFFSFSEAERIIEPEEKTRKISTEEDLHIVVLAFKSELKWRFIRKNGTTIHALITDESFIDHMKSGQERFADGDILSVTLEFEQRFDEKLQVWNDLKTSYKIVKVNNHHRLPQNKTLF